MFTLLALGALLASSLVRADPNPTTPGPTDVYDAGGQCTIAWVPDTTGTWTTMNIELMTGSNTAMVFLTTVATVDGTNASATPFVYPCPAVIPNSQIYFYQFSSPASADILWTTRFTLADANGQSTPPTNATQPGTNDAIPWGTGALANPADATPPPGNATTTGNSTTSTVSPSAAATTTTPAALPPALAPVSPTSTTSSSSSNTVTGTAAANQGSNSNGAMVIVVDDRIWKAAMALVAAAVAFGVAI
jgi:hypothetical protein